MAFEEHPLRAELTAEMNARPHAVISAPAQISHIACVTGEAAGEDDREHLIELCRTFKISAPAASASQFDADFGPFRLKWERHTEFSTYTLIKEARFEQPFKDCPISEVPSDWLDKMPGKVLTAMHIAIETGATPEREGTELAGLFDNNSIVGGSISENRASVWTDYQLHADGFLRFLVRDCEMSASSLGRYVKRLCELETYRMMALLALPPAREARPVIAKLEQDLSDILQTLAFSDGTDDEQRLLELLSKVAAETERTSASLNYRFSASRAYQELVAQRVSGIRIGRINGVQPFTDYVMTRFAPAMETRDNLSRRIETLSRRVARASDLLRTRVDVALEAQNRDLLQSMDRRAKLQLRLQQTVEGLSVVAISYYLLGLLGYIVKGVHETAPVEFETDVVIMALMVPVIAAVWWGVHRIRDAVLNASNRQD
ncbi:DUF3422 domain-containing protein [Thalassospiraceae bacterium LMO-JJ14]|nr:DUF3422 domain-containing protein [Thalassospiraceae bacterium LMO-JJ14]